MDIMTSVGLVTGIIVISVMMLLGGDLHMFISEHAVIIIFGGSIAATMIRFPLGAILHGVPLGANWAWDDQAAYYSPQISALTLTTDSDYDVGTVRLTLTPDASPGRPARLAGSACRRSSASSSFSLTAPSACTRSSAPSGPARCRSS